MSRFGVWEEQYGLPAFAYTADPGTVPEWDTLLAGMSRRHWAGVGNRRIQLFADNDGTAALFDEFDGLRWLAVERPFLPAGAMSVRVFGPIWFHVGGGCAERTILCPEGEVPWVLIRVRSRAASPSRFVEEWELRPRFLNLLSAHAGLPAEQAELEETAKRCIRYDIDVSGTRIRAVERRQGDLTREVELEGGRRTRFPVVFGAPRTLVLEALATPDVEAKVEGNRLQIATSIDAGETECWFRFGVDDGSTCEDPAGLFEQCLERVRERLPTASSANAPMARREVPWHAALLTGGACVDGILGGHTLDQGSTYSFLLGFNGVARDPLQHALPLVYSEPDLALSVLRNTLSWGDPGGRLAYVLDGAKALRGGPELGFLEVNEHPSDLGLWALWLAAEYAAATGDLRAFSEPLPFHPAYRADEASLYDHLRLLLDYLHERVGLGGHGLLRMLHCDWSDGHVGELDHLGVTRADMNDRGESVLNSALAAWVLPVFAALAERLGDTATGTAARSLAARLRNAVAATWNGRWFTRALVGDVAVGDDTLFLEVQPWAILCGAAGERRSRELLGTVDERLRANSPLGARRCSPLPTSTPVGFPGEGLRGGIWLTLQAWLVWAAARLDPRLAWDEWRRMTLTTHTEYYPDVWEGTISGPTRTTRPSPRAPAPPGAFPAGRTRCRDSRSTTCTATASRCSPI